MKKLLPFVLTLGILICVGWTVNSSPQTAFASAVSQPAATASSANAVPAAQPASQATGQEQGTTATSETRPEPPTRAQRRSYERETGRRHRGISKKEVIFLAAIAGTSMGIGAVAAGAHGLAIGSIVGGWAAFGGHFLWNKLH